MFALIARSMTFNPIFDLPTEVEPLIRKFGEMFPEDLPNELPPMRDIQYAIDLFP